MAKLLLEQTDEEFRNILQGHTRDSLIEIAILLKQMKGISASIIEEKDKQISLMDEMIERLRTNKN